MLAARPPLAERIALPHGRSTAPESTNRYGDLARTAEPAGRGWGGVRLRRRRRRIGGSASVPEPEPQPGPGPGGREDDHGEEGHRDGCGHGEDDPGDLPGSWPAASVAGARLAPRRLHARRLRIPADSGADPWARLSSRDSGAATRARQAGSRLRRAARVRQAPVRRAQPDRAEGSGTEGSGTEGSGTAGSGAAALGTAGLGTAGLGLAALGTALWGAADLAMVWVSLGRRCACFGEAPAPGGSPGDSSASSSSGSQGSPSSASPS